MVDRPVVVPKWGQYLIRKREERGLTPGQVEVLVADRYGLPLAHSVLWRYEAGQVGSPDPAIIWALSRIYRINSDEIIGCLAKERAKRPLSQSELATPQITDRSSGLSDDAVEIARLYDQLDAAHQAMVKSQGTMLKEIERQMGKSETLTRRRRRR